MRTGVAAEPDWKVRDRRLDEVCGHLNALSGELIDLAVEALADPSTISGNGIHTPRQYIAWRCGISARRAGQVVAIAERVESLPRCVQLLRDGLISIDQLAVIAEHAPDWADGELCDLAAHMTVAQLRRTVNMFPTDPGPGTDSDRPDNESPEVASRPDSFSMNRADGRFSLAMETDAIAGAIIERALSEARNALFLDDPDSATWTAAVAEVAQRSLDAVTDPGRRDRYRLHIHVNTDQPADRRDPHGWHIPDNVANYFTCDCAVVPTLLADGIPISIGRTSRIIPERTRRQVIYRDHGCRVPGCDPTHHLEIHHIVHWTKGGPTDVCNLIALCGHHHRLHHRGDLHITGNASLPAGAPGAVMFTTSDGTVLTSSGARPEPPGAAPPQPAKTYHGPAGERLELRWLDFRHPDDRNRHGWHTNHQHN
ncbi:MAG: DUF222 domain-containing protein [Actinomycetota bacterium]